MIAILLLIIVYLIYLAVSQYDQKIKIADAFRRFIRAHADEMEQNSTTQEIDEILARIEEKNP